MVCCPLPWYLPSTEWVLCRLAPLADRCLRNGPNGNGEAALSYPRPQLVVHMRASERQLWCGILPWPSTALEAPKPAFNIIQAFLLLFQMFPGGTMVEFPCPAFLLKSAPHPLQLLLTLLRDFTDDFL